MFAQRYLERWQQREKKKRKKEKKANEGFLAMTRCARYAQKDETFETLSFIQYLRSFIDARKQRARKLIILVQHLNTHSKHAKVNNIYSNANTKWQLK